MTIRETAKVTVLLADDHPIVMTGFTLTLESHGIKVVGQAKSPDEAIELFAALHPAVLILDIRFGKKLTGLDLAKQILEKNPHSKIIFLSQFDQTALIKEAYQIGGFAFITKDCDPDVLATAVIRASQGQRFYMPHVAERLAEMTWKGDRTPQAVLSDREMQIFKQMALGLTNAEIAEKLGLSSKTISNTSQTIKEKLGIHRPAEITRLAIRKGLIEP